MNTGLINDSKYAVKAFIACVSIGTDPNNIKLEDLNPNQIQVASSNSTADIPLTCALDQYEIVFGVWNSSSTKGSPDSWVVLSSSGIEKSHFGNFTISLIGSQTDGFVLLIKDKPAAIKSDHMILIVFAVLLLILAIGLIIYFLTRKPSPNY